MQKATFPPPFTTLIRNPNVTGHACLWATLGPLAALALIEYVDTNPPVSTVFYRTVQP